MFPRTDRESPYILLRHPSMIATSKLSCRAAARRRRFKSRRLKNRRLKTPTVILSPRRLARPEHAYACAPPTFFWLAWSASSSTPPRPPVHIIRRGGVPHDGGPRTRAPAALNCPAATTTATVRCRFGAGPLTASEHSLTKQNYTDASLCFLPPGDGLRLGRVLLLVLHLVHHLALSVAHNTRGLGGGRGRGL